MLTNPAQINDQHLRKRLAIEMRNMLITGSAFVEYLNNELATMDIEQRTEFKAEIYKPRQGAAIAISQILDFINNSKQEVANLEG